MKVYAPAVFIAALLQTTVTCFKPMEASYYRAQLVNHDNPREGTWSQRYYLDQDNFGGKGYPIFLIPGGSDAIDPDTGILYDFVSTTLAQSLGAVIIQPEHRFYGKSQPLTPTNITRWPELLTPEQAMKDTLKLLTYVQDVILGCSKVPGNRDYCPVVTIGAGYSGFLAAMLRYIYPGRIDMSWASSAPIRLYEQKVKSFDYYDRITKVADEALPGCSTHVRDTLYSLADAINTTNYITVAQDLGLCLELIPPYIRDDNMFLEEVNMVVATKFSQFNRHYYPPNHDSELYSWCRTFSDPTLDVNSKLQLFLSEYLDEDSEGFQACLSLTTPQAPDINGTISKSDWTKYGTLADRTPWDFQGCSSLVSTFDFSERSMFIPRTQTKAWLSQHCNDRFRVTPNRLRLAKDFELDKIGEKGTKMIFTNGKNDGFYNTGIRMNLNSTIISINLKNGAQASDLRYTGNFESGTFDLSEAYKEIFVNLRGWIDELQPLTKKAKFKAPFEF